MTRDRPRHRRRSTPRFGALARVAVIVGFVLASGLVATLAAEVWSIDDPDLRGAPNETTELEDIPVVERPARPQGAPAVAELAPSPPVRVEIPSIGVSSGLETLALDAQGMINPPRDFDVAGWFAVGPQPGQPGPAVVAGHVDSQDGPAVFYRLDELAVGDEVLVERRDGSVVRFRVTGSQTYPKDQFPTAAVYGPVPGPELRLITCGGPFDQSRHQYLDNLVIYAALA